MTMTLLLSLQDRPLLNNQLGYQLTIVHHLLISQLLKVYSEVINYTCLS